MRSRLVVTVLLCGLLSGCATNSTPLNPYDPYEEHNRNVFELNQKLDRHVLEPVASGYAAITPSFFRRGVDNFFNNASYPKVILSDLLQGKFAHAARGTGRFLVNTTVGLLGIWDPASRIGLPARRSDMGQTLAVWGANSGPYIEVLGLGPNYARELSDIPASIATNPLGYIFTYHVTVPLAALYFVNKRAQLDKAVQIREQAALDPYLFTRSAYMQYRQNLIYEGNPPQDELYDESLFDDDWDESEAE
ncbi:MAG: VacJ family lipoprotein [Xanthomonadaceae bacterium]|nr:VacJ family lipoprotein [Xanthomonadaceae bacterium]